MIEVESIIEKLNNVINDTDKGIDMNDLIECKNALCELSEEKDVHRYEVIATGYVKDLSYIQHKDKENGLVKFLLEKMRRDSKGNAIRGYIACIMDENKLTENILNGDRVKIWGDFSPYETKREDGFVFHKIRLWLDKVERIERGKSENK